MSLGAPPPPAARRPARPVPCNPPRLPARWSDLATSGAGGLARLHDQAATAAGITSAATVRPVARLNLQFDVRPVGAYAARYPDEADTLVLAIGYEARRRGHYTGEEFIAACRWKTPGSGPLVATNSLGEIETATRIALSDASTERERVYGTRTRGRTALAGRRRVSDRVGAAASGLPGALPHPRQAGSARADSDQRPRTGFASGPITSRSTGGWSHRPGWTVARLTGRFGNGRASRVCRCTEASDGQALG
jgi:hypothetical protein